MANIEVSIICSAYNHEKYIRDAIEGFLKQETNFEFEVLLHDDASTDHTADIIREYEEKYPDIIKPIYQTENQYSKHVSIGNTYQYPRAKGKYIAICEGDDYWTDPHKLQKQYDMMENHPEVDICAHASTLIEASSNKKVGMCSPVDETCIIPARDVIKGGGEFVMTNSLFYRSEIQKEMPEFRKLLNLDYTIQVHGALRGGMLFIAEDMSVYRVNAQKSWISRMKKNKEKKVAHLKKTLRMLKQLDKDTNGKYHWTISERVLRLQTKIIWIKVSDLFGKRG